MGAEQKLGGAGSAAWAEVLLRLDETTAFVTSAFALAGVTAGMYFVARTRRTYPGFRSWMLSLACAMAAFLMFAFRGENPGVLSLIVSNAVALAVTPLHLDGVLRFFATPRLRLWRSLNAALAAAAIVGFAIAAASGAELRTRVVIASAALAVHFSLTTAVLCAYAARRRSAPVTLMALVSGVVMACALLRAASPLWSGPLGVYALSDSAVAAGAAMATLFCVLLAVAMITAHVERVEGELHHTQAKLEQLAAQDDLTGLDNRRTFFERAHLLWELAERYDRPVAVLVCDADHFKAVNDLYGHAAGDDVLRALALALASAKRGTDLLARIGGEEFALILPETDETAALQVADRLRAAVRSALMPRPGPDHVTLSVGVAVRHPTDADLLTAMRRADGALLKAKIAGRDRALLAPASD